MRGTLNMRACVRACVRALSWGEDGFFRIKRSSALSEGEYNLGIEEFCSWVMPAF